MAPCCTTSRRGTTSSAPSSDGSWRCTRRRPGRHWPRRPGMPTGWPGRSRALSTVVRRPAFVAQMDLWTAARTDPDLARVVSREERRAGSDLARVVDDVFGRPLTDHPRYRAVAGLTVQILRGLALTDVLRGDAETAQHALDDWTRHGARPTHPLGGPAVSSLVLYEVRNRKAYLTLNRPDRLNAIDRRGCPARLRAARRRGERRPRRARHRAAGRRPGVQRGLRHEGVRRGRRRHPGRGVGPDPRLRPDEAQHRRLLQPVAVAEADGREGARLRRRRRQRHRAVLRPGRHGRRRPHRLHARARVGLPDDGDVGLPARRRAGQADAAHRRHDRRPDRRGVGSGRRVGARRRSWTRRSRRWPTASPACRSTSWPCRS